MFVLQELSSGEDDASKNKSNEIITSLDNKNVVDISDDDVTVVLCQTDDDQSTPKKCSEEEKEEKEEISISYKQDGTRKSCLSLRSNKSVSKGSSNLTKQPNEESGKILQGKPIVEVNKNTPFRKTEIATNREDVSFEFQNSSEAMVVPRSRKVFTPNVKPKTTRSLKKQRLSASSSLPETITNADSSFSSLPEKKQSNAVEKSDEESIVEKRGHQSSTSKRPKEQSELDGEQEKELEKRSFKFEKFKEMMDKMGSAVILLHRLSPLIIAKSHVADQRKLSLNEESEAPSNLTSPVSDEAKVSSTSKGDEMAEVELIASPEEVDRKSKKSLIRRRKEVGSADVNGASEKKRPRVSEEEDRISSASFDSGVSVFLKDRSAVIIVNQQVKNSSKGSSSSSNEEKEHESSSKVNLPTARPRRGRQSKSGTSVSTNINVSKDDSILPAGEKDKVFDPKSKEALPCLANSESSNESEDKEEASVSGSKPAVEEILERETTDQDVEFILQEGYSSIENSSKRGRGRPLKNIVSKFGIASVPLLNANEIDVGAKSTKLSTHRMVNKRAVESEKSDASPQKKKCLSGETTMSPVVKSDNEDFGRSEDINDIQQVFVSVRRGRGRPSKTAISLEKTIQKSSVDQVVNRSTKKTISVTPETRVKYCNVLLERDPEIEALCIKMKNRQEKKSTEKVAAAKPRDEIPAKSTSKVTRGIKKLVSKSEPDKVAPFSPRRKLRVRQI